MTFKNKAGLPISSRPIRNSVALQQAMFLNIWGGRKLDNLFTLFEKYKPITEFFCLTEVPNYPVEPGEEHLYYNERGEPPAVVNSYTRIKAELGDEFESRYDAVQPGRTRTCQITGKMFVDVRYGSALFWKKDSISVIAHGSEEIISGYQGVKPRIVQWIVYVKDGRIHLLAHLHGVWLPGVGKNDHSLRQQQSAEFLNILLKLQKQFEVTRTIFGGDFNLDLSTQALRDLEADGLYTNLIKNTPIVSDPITSTRTELYRNFDSETLYADYVFVNESLDVFAIQALDEIVVSDHKPLLLHFTA